MLRAASPRRKAAGEVFQVFTLEAGMIPGRIPFWKAAHIAQVLRRHVYCHVLGPAPHLPSAGVFLVWPGVTELSWWTLRPQRRVRGLLVRVALAGERESSLQHAAALPGGKAAFSSHQSVT